MQTSYSISMAVAQTGQLADLGPNDIVSKVNVVDALTSFGLAVVQGATDDQAHLPSLSTDKVIGVVVHVANREQALGTGIVGFKKSDVLPVLMKGRIWVLVDGPVVVNGPVFVRFAGGQAGVFRSDADTANATLVDGASFATSAFAGGLAIVNFNLPA